MWLRNRWRTPSTTVEGRGKRPSYRDKETNKCTIKTGKWDNFQRALPWQPDGDPVGQPQIRGSWSKGAWGRGWPPCWVASGRPWPANHWGGWPRWVPQGQGSLCPAGTLGSCAQPGVKESHEEWCSWVYDLRVMEDEVGVLLQRHI